jgi:hypothetical protein
MFLVPRRQTPFHAARLPSPAGKTVSRSTPEDTGQRQMDADAEKWGTMIAQEKGRSVPEAKSGPAGE